MQRSECRCRKVGLNVYLLSAETLKEQPHNKSSGNQQNSHVLKSRDSFGSPNNVHYASRIRQPALYGSRLEGFIHR